MKWSLLVKQTSVRNTQIKTCYCLDDDHHGRRLKYERSGIGTLLIKFNKYNDIYKRSRICNSSFFDRFILRLFVRHLQDIGYFLTVN